MCCPEAMLSAAEFDWMLDEGEDQHRDLPLYGLPQVPFTVKLNRLSY